MDPHLRLVVFDVDGTLVDSQNDIVTGMTRAFGEVGFAAPARADILSTVGLSLPEGVAQLLPDAPAQQQERVVAAYKDIYFTLRQNAGSRQSAPLYDGIAETLVRLHAVDPILLGVATGKSRRGLNILLDAHGLQSYFITQQCADDHPSKPHPAMLQTAMSDAGVAPSDTVMVGDTAFDLEMARAAGAQFVGVTWGYHGRDRLRGADEIVETVADLAEVLLDLGGTQ